MKIKRRIKLFLARRFLGFCTHLNVAVSIRSNGTIEPCACVGTEKKEEFIPFGEQPGRSIHSCLNSAMFIATRRYVQGKKAEGEMFSVCRNCVLKEHTRYPFIRLDTLLAALRGCSFPAGVRKLKNLALLLYEVIAQKEHLKAYPVYANIDPVNACNLHCPFCIVGAGKDVFKPEFIPLERYKQILEELGDYLIHLSLYRYGEPLLHPDIGRLITVAKSYGIYVHLSTNLLLLNDEKCKEIIDASPDQIVVCADGVTEESYQKYRQGGEFALFKKNLIKLVDAVRASGKNIEVKWQYLVFRYNEGEINEAESLADELHIPFSAEPAYIPDGEEYAEFRPRSPEYTYER